MCTSEVQGTASLPTPPPVTSVLTRTQRGFLKIHQITDISDISDICIERASRLELHVHLIFLGLQNRGGGTGRARVFRPCRDAEEFGLQKACISGHLGGVDNQTLLPSAYTGAATRIDYPLQKIWESSPESGGGDLRSWEMGEKEGGC